MAKWADYVVVAVRFNASRTHIDQLKVAKDNDDSIGAAEDVSRATVITRIKSGTSFISAFRNPKGEWSKGKLLFITRIGGVEYVKTVPDDKTVDNLDDLVTF